MTNNASVVAANELDRISNVLTAYDVSPKLGSEDGTDGWLPGDPLYRRPMKGFPGHQWTRPMFEEIDVDDEASVLRVPSESGDENRTEYWEPTCRTCEVSWSGPEPCWVCGEQPVGMQSAAALLEQLRRSQSRGFVRFMPAGENVAAPTLSEIEAAELVPGLRWSDPTPEEVDLFRGLVDRGTVHHVDESWRLTRENRASAVDDLMAASLAMTTEGFRHLAWESVAGGVTYDDSHPGVPKYTIEIRHAGETVGATVYLDHREDFAKSMHRAVKAITLQMAYRGGRSAGA